MFFAYIGFQLLQLLMWHNYQQVTFYLPCLFGRVTTSRTGDQKSTLTEGSVMFYTGPVRQCDQTHTAQQVSGMQKHYQGLPELWQAKYAHSGLTMGVPENKGKPTVIWMSPSGMKPTERL